MEGRWRAGQGSGAGLGRADARSTQPFFELDAADVPSRMLAGNSQRVESSDDRVTATLPYRRGHERGERFGQSDGMGAEAQRDGAVGDRHIVDAQMPDRGGPLGIERDEQADDAVLGDDRAVVQQPPRPVPACFEVQQPGGRSIAGLRS
jgi:hypothetical protein